MEERLRGYINSALKDFGSTDVAFVVERPADMGHGDYATNVAMAAFAKYRSETAGQIGVKANSVAPELLVGDKKITNPRAFAEEVKSKLDALNDPDITAVEIAGPGFINIRCSKDFYIRELGDALKKGETFGNNDTLKGKKVIVEYTDPNPFKEFHIGHLMSNAVGESISRLIEASGAETKRACYQGDVGLHVAHAVAKEMENIRLDSPVQEIWVGGIQSTATAYVLAMNYAKTNEEFANYVKEINQRIYDRKDENVNKVYDLGRKISLDYFEKIYKRLNTKFDFKFFESNTGVFGKEVVEKHPEIFEKSDGAIVYKGDESKGLHTRVFINKDGLPTYEAKELGLAKIKYDTYPYDTSIVITGNEVNDYFKVLLDAMSKVFPDLAAKTEHYSHGMLRLPTGKMSSRTGDVITAESMINETKERAMGKITAENFSVEEKDDISEKVAIGAIKYSILRQAAGKDIIFDFEQSLSFEGDSGPYLQYAHARTRSLLAKAEGRTINPAVMVGEEIRPLHKYILRFPEIILRAQIEREPHYVTNYLVELAREFSAFYGNTQVLDGSPDEPYKLALVEMTSHILKHGLWLLGIMAPEKM